MNHKTITRLSFLCAVASHALVLTVFPRHSAEEPIPSTPVTLTMHTVSRSSCQQPEPPADRPDTPPPAPVKGKIPVQQKRETRPQPKPASTPASPHTENPLQQPQTVSGPSSSSAQSRQSAAASRPSPDKYLSTVRTLIEQNKYYPSFARRLEHEGIVHLRLVIAADGTIKSLNILNASGYSTLDKAALKAVRKAGPFPPPPAENQQAITVPLTYSLY
ncbi:MAG: energy transducer TonB [Prosthecochloris sp.]|nr:energy transducer TonB [Prosthecochloris sp.]